MLAELHLARAEDEARLVRKLFQPRVSGRSIGDRFRERVDLYVRLAPVPGQQLPQHCRRADVTAGEPVHRLRDLVVVSRQRLARLRPRIGMANRVGGDQRREDASARDGREGIDLRKDSQLVQTPRRAEVEERSTVAAAGKAERDPLALGARQRQVRRLDPELGDLAHRVTAGSVSAAPAATYGGGS